MWWPGRGIFPDTCNSSFFCIRRQQKDIDIFSTDPIVSEARTQMVASRREIDQLISPGASEQNYSYDGCQLARLGWTHVQGTGAGHVDISRVQAAHQRTRTEGNLVDLRVVCQKSSGTACADQDRQCDSQSIYQATKGNQVKDSESGGITTTDIGGSQPLIHSCGTSGRTGQLTSRLAESSKAN